MFLVDWRNIFTFVNKKKILFSSLQYSQTVVTMNSKGGCTSILTEVLLIVRISIIIRSQVKCIKLTQHVKKFMLASLNN